MKKNYSVRILATCDVLVIGAKNEDHAIELAEDEASTGDFEVIEMTTSQIKTADHLESVRRHCQCVSEP